MDLSAAAAIVASSAIAASVPDREAQEIFQYMDHGYSQDEIAELMAASTGRPYTVGAVESRFVPRPPRSTRQPLSRNTGSIVTRFIVPVATVLMACLGAAGTADADEDQDAEDARSFRDLIDQSSLGTPGVRALRSRTPEVVVSLIANRLHARRIEPGCDY